MWTPEIDNRLIELRKKHGQRETAKRLSLEFKQRITKDMVRHREVKLRLKGEQIEPSYKEEHEILKDGTHRSSKLIAMDEQQSKDETYLLQAFGYSADDWKIVTAKSSMWDHHNKKDGTITLYASKITVEPKTENFTYEDLIKVIESQEPIYFNPTKHKINTHRLLEIAPVDTHFGISNYEYYIPNLNRIIEKVESKRWEEIVIPVGNDLFHNDDFRGRTSSGREIQKVDMSVAWEDAKRFYYPIIEKAIKNANNVKVVYVKGNHDESMSWAFTDNLKTKFPEIECDLDINEHKAHIFHDVFLGLTHGDKNMKNLANIFNAKFRMEIAKAKTREVHKAHRHGEEATDNYGIMVRTLPTQNKEDEWHDMNGYVGKNKRFQLFEYSENELESIYYV